MVEGRQASPRAALGLPGPVLPRMSPFVRGQVCFALSCGQVALTIPCAFTYTHTHTDTYPLFYTNSQKKTNSKHKTRTNKDPQYSKIIPLLSVPWALEHWPPGRAQHAGSPGGPAPWTPGPDVCTKRPFLATPLLTAAGLPEPPVPSAVRRCPPTMARAGCFPSSQAGCRLRWDGCDLDPRGRR